MTRNFRPQLFKRQEQKYENKQTSHVAISEGELNQYKQKIAFWSFTFLKINPHTTYDRSFRIYTRKLIKWDDIINCLSPVFPDAKIKKCLGYSSRHTFDIHTKEPIRWDILIKTVVLALRDIL